MSLRRSPAPREGFLQSLGPPTLLPWSHAPRPRPGLLHPCRLVLSLAVPCSFPSLLPCRGGGARCGWGPGAPPFCWGLLSSPRLPSHEVWVSSCLLAWSPVLQVLLPPSGLLSTTSSVTRWSFWRGFSLRLVYTENLGNPHLVKF